MWRRAFLILAKRIETRVIDTHCHLDFPVFDADRDAVWARARAVGVRGLVIPGVTLAGFERIVGLRGPGCEIALGLHPVFLADHPEDGLARLEGWLRGVVPLAVGEIGLDHLLPPETHAVQAVLFEAQLRLAMAFDRPVLLHVRRAHDPVVALLKRLKFPCGGIVHAFGGSLEQARDYIRLGFCLGMGGVVTRERATRIRQVAAAVDETALVLESDAPDLPPVSRYWQRNEPACLAEVVETLAGLRGVAVEGLIAATTRNARRVLNWREG
ncbi:putative metal-dependent hydrolase YjjV [Candidatus Magnetaquicoccaceae bacterium FCR-1]|uniref:Metal-dependent hydrolase YjjV n=1 Tax=Candidatus Magnetaquiglobus chichijimensis TaxID=3141448 RepID=A0ABQ0C9E3_9PROT